MDADRPTETRIVLCGDSHGNSRFIRTALNVAAEEGISRVIQLGDFGIWPGGRGTRYLDEIDRAASALGVQLEFIDGNHEDFDQLDALYANAPRRSDGAVRVRDNIWWWPRGSVTDIGGRRFGFLGGTTSIDAHRRTARHSWWPQEKISDDDVDALISNTQSRFGQHATLDVLCAHDVFKGIAVPGSAMHIPADLLAAANDDREKLLRAVISTSPGLFVHGHWHLDYHTEKLVGTKTLLVRGLSDESRSAIAVLDLASLRVLGTTPTLRDLRKKYSAAL